MTDTAIWTPYCGAAPQPGEWLTLWNLDPVVIGALLLGSALFLRTGPSAIRQRWFLLGVGVLAILFVSPLCALTSALFSVRVAHHLLLTSVAAPLFAAAVPHLRLARAGVGVWAVVHATIFWLWHAPSVYAWALNYDAAYWLMVIALLVSGMGLWVSILAARPPIAIAALLGTMVQMGLLGALLTFAGTPLYAPHMLSTAAWGLSPLEDQQLAGLIMWVPGSGAYLAVALAIIARLLDGRVRSAVPAA